MNLVGRFPRYRILVSRLFGLGLVGLLLLSHRPLFAAPAAQLANWAGFVLLLVCAFGRLWSLQYLAGFKSRRVISDGPYSIVRNTELVIDVTMRCVDEMIPMANSGWNSTLDKLEALLAG